MSARSSAGEAKFKVAEPACADPPSAAPGDPDGARVSRADASHHEDGLTKEPSDANEGRGRRESGRLSRLVIALLSIMVLVLVGVILKGQSAPVETAAADNRSIDYQAAPLVVQVIHAGSLDAPRMTRAYAGRLIADRESRLGFERPGRMVRINVREGQVIEAGEVLAELDQEALDAAEHRIQGNLDSAQAVLAELEAGPRKETIAAARARVEELSARVALSKIDAQRQAQLAPQGATSRSQLDAAVYGLQADQQALVAAKEALNELLAGTRDEQLQAQRAACEAIRAQLKEIQAQRNDSRIVAPFSGQIRSRLIDEGVVVSAGTPVLHLMSDQIEVQIGLPPKVAATFKVGDEVSIELNGRHRRAWTDRLSPNVDPATRTRDAFFRLTSSTAQALDPEDRTFERELFEDGWVAGEVVDVHVPAVDRVTRESHFWLPVSSLDRGTRGLWTVLVVYDDGAGDVCERRSVEVLKTDGAYSLVQGMLSPGERVVADGVHRVTAGMKVIAQVDTDVAQRQRLDGLNAKSSEAH